MNIIEIIGASTIGIIIAAEFLAAIGIAITLYKIYGVTRRLSVPQVHHHHHHYSSGQHENEEEFGDDEKQEDIDPEGLYE